MGNEVCKLGIRLIKELGNKENVMSGNRIGIKSLGVGMYWCWWLIDD